MLRWLPSPGHTQKGRLQPRFLMVDDFDLSKTKKAKNQKQDGSKTKNLYNQDGSKIKNIYCTVI